MTPVPFTTWQLSPVGCTETVTAYWEPAATRVGNRNALVPVESGTVSAASARISPLAFNPVTAPPTV